MNRKTIFITAGIVGVLLGVGFLAHHLMKEEDQADPRKNTDEKPKPKVNVAENKAKVTSTDPKPEIPIPPNEAQQILQQQPELPAKPEPVFIIEKPEVEEAEVELPTLIKEPLPAPKMEITYIAPQADEFPLRLGSRGKRVERLQVWLMRNFGWTGKITGLLDEKTEALMEKRLHTRELTEAIYKKHRMGKHVQNQTIIQ
jgi:hypothetical protein